MKNNIRSVALFGMIGAVMYVSKVLMEFLPNIHLLAVFITALTVVYRKKALYPLYAYVLLEGLFRGFSLWWVPYLYVWTVLWGMVMLIPRSLPKKWCPVVYMGVCGLHGLLFGMLYAPAQALMFGLSFRGMLMWIAAGFPYDLIHAGGNFVLGSLAVPLIRLFEKMEKGTSL